MLRIIMETGIIRVYLQRVCKETMFMNKNQINITEGICFPTINFRKENNYIWKLTASDDEKATLSLIFSYPKC